MSGLRLPAAGAALSQSPGRGGARWARLDAGLGSGRKGCAPARCSPPRRSFLPSPPGFSLLFLQQLFWERLPLLYLGLEPRIHFRGGHAGGGVSEFCRTPSFTYPASGLPGLIFRLVRDRIKVKVFSCSGLSLNISCLEAGSYATNGLAERSFMN